MAPVDIIISILETAKNEALNERNEQLKKDCPGGLPTTTARSISAKNSSLSWKGFKKLFN